MSKSNKGRMLIPWWPQPRQLTFLRACGLAHPFDGGLPGRPAARVIGYGGAAGGGKSDALLLAAIIACLTWARCNVGYFRREFPQLEGPGGAILRSHELLTGLARWNGTNHRWTFPNGSILQFCHVKNEDDVFSYQSQQFDVILLDEGTQFTRFQYRYLLTRNRATVDGVTPFMAIGTNPGNIGHQWFKDEFVNIGPVEVPSEVEVEPGQYETHVFIPAKLQDNQVLEKRDPGYRMTLESQTENLRRALLDGDWDIFAGQYFREFRREKHVIEPVEMPDWWRRFRSIDWGYNDPCAVYWHAVGPDRRVYTYRELYVREMTASQLAARITEMSAGEEIDYTVMSPDAWARRGNDAVVGESIAETLHKAGVYVVKADNNRLNGWMRMREYLRDAPDGKPYWQIFSTCANLIRTLPQLIHDEHNVEDVSDKCEDHAAESCRYALMSRPPVSEEPAKPKAQLPFALRTDEEIRQEGSTWLSWQS